MGRVGDYRLVRRIAVGGTAEVWEATAEAGPLTGSRVALKRSLPHGRAGAPERMIRAEARIAQQLDHPALVRVLDAGTEPDGAWIAMELVDGLDAGRAVAFARAHPRPMPEGVALHVVATVGAGLDYAHRLRAEDGSPLGIVHRDVSPPNILLGWEGRACLGDFGLVMSADREVRTTTGVVQGMEAFMAPEQAIGDRVGWYTDVYGLGATLHALVTGRPPLASWAALIRRVRGAPLVLAEELAPDIEALVRECMELSAVRRPPGIEVARIAGHAAARRLGEGGGPAALAAWLATVRAESRGELDDLFDF